MSSEARRLAALREWRAGFAQTMFSDDELDALIWDIATTLLR